MEQIETECATNAAAEATELQTKCIPDTAAVIGDLAEVPTVCPTEAKGEQQQIENFKQLDSESLTNVEENILETDLIAAVLDQQPLIANEVEKAAADEKSSSSSKELNSTQTTPNRTPPIEVEMASSDSEPKVDEAAERNETAKALLQQQRLHYEQKLEQLTAALKQKDNMIALFERENALLEKEKQAFRKEMELANKEKESTVIKFAMKEKLLIDAKKEKDLVEKQLADARKEVKNVTTRFHAVNEEKSRITYIIDEKCNEVRKYQRECEKLKTDYNHLESKLKYHINKLNMETEAKLALEKKLEEERNAPNKIEEKALEKLKVEHEANTILLRHEIEYKTEQIELLTKEHKKSGDLIKELREQLFQITKEKNAAINDLETVQAEHIAAQNALSEEMLNSAKLRGQLEELQVLRTQNALNEEKICNLNEKIKQLEDTIEFNSHDLQELRAKELELLTANKELSESLVNLQNEICLTKAELQGTLAENVLLKRERNDFDEKYEALERRLQKELEQKSEERQLLAKHLSEKTKLYETTKLKLENLLGDFEANNHKHANVVKELQREIQKHKKLNSSQHHSQQQQQHYYAPENATSQAASFDYQQRNLNGKSGNDSECSTTPTTTATHSRPLSRNSSCNERSAASGEASDAETTVAASQQHKTTATTMVTVAADGSVKGPSKKHLVERILRLQQAAARQTEKIDFLENHTLSLVAELQKKSKVVQYYMLRDQAGALTSTKSDQHKSELSKYGNGVMSAIYGGFKADNKTSMTLELSLEINKKLQAVLEDTLLKNITLKENLDVLGIEVDNLTRKLRFLESKE